MEREKERETERATEREMKYLIKCCGSLMKQRRRGTDREGRQIDKDNEDKDVFYSSLMCKMSLLATVGQ